MPTRLSLFRVILTYIHRYYNFLPSQKKLWIEFYALFFSIKEGNVQYLLKAYDSARKYIRSYSGVS